jgi:hypothetical protein
LGHIIFEEGMTVDPVEIEAIMGCFAPKNVLDVRFLMGLVVY